VTVVLATEPADRAAAFGVRHAVFVVEQGVPVELEIDDLDAEADHFVVYAGSAAVGAARLLVEDAGFADGDPAAGPVAHLGRLAVLASRRGQGYGAALVQAVEAAAQLRGLHRVALASQTHAIPFYERLGYVAHGDVFNDAGLPHRWMRKTM